MATCKSVAIPENNMKKIPPTLLAPFKKWLAQQGYQGKSQGPHLRAWKLKQKQLEIMGLEMNKACRPVFQMFLNEYLKQGKEFISYLNAQTYNGLVIA